MKAVVLLTALLGSLVAANPVILPTAAITTEVEKRALPSGSGHCYFSCPRKMHGKMMIFADYATQEEIDGVQYQICLYAIDYDGNGSYDVNDACSFSIKTGELCTALNCYNFEGQCENEKAPYTCSPTPPSDAWGEDKKVGRSKMHPRIQALQWKAIKERNDWN